MNGPVRMYRTKPIIRHDSPVELPKCMYRMRSVHVVATPPPPKPDITEQVKQFLKINSRNVRETMANVLSGRRELSVGKRSLEVTDQKTNGLTAMAALELRQQDILKQLAALKKQMQALKADLKSSPFVNTRHSPAKTVATTPTEDLSKHPDVVINASPSFPPYSLQLLQELWRGSLGLKVKTHLHSSVKDVPEDVVEFGSALEGFQSGAKAVLNVRLIWKDVGPNTELVISPVVISGEANILRYLSRISPNFNYDSLEKPYELDVVLDASYRLVRARTKTERARLIQIFNKSLGKGQWMCGRKEATIADVAVWSAVKQAAEGEIGANLGKWYGRCRGGTA